MVTTVLSWGRESKTKDILFIKNILITLRPEANSSLVATWHIQHTIDYST